MTVLFVFGVSRFIRRCLSKYKFGWVLQGRPQAATRLPQVVIACRTTWLGLSFTAGRNLTNQWSCSFPSCDVWSDQHLTATLKLAYLVSIRSRRVSNQVYDSTTTKKAANILSVD